MKQGKKVSWEIDATSREEFLNTLDMDLLLQQIRINQGTYEITIRKLTRRELKKQTEDKKPEWTVPWP